MSSLLEFLQKERKLSFIFWFKYYWNNILNTFYEKKVSSKIDNSWKGIKISHTVKPALYPKNINNNSVTLYMELQALKENKLWKRN